MKRYSVQLFLTLHGLSWGNEMGSNVHLLLHYKWSNFLLTSIFIRLKIATWALDQASSTFQYLAILCLIIIKGQLVINIHVSVRLVPTPPPCPVVLTVLRWRDTWYQQWVTWDTCPGLRLCHHLSTRYFPCHYNVQDTPIMCQYIFQIGYPSMDERERREINNTTMGYEEVGEKSLKFSIDHLIQCQTWYQSCPNWQKSWLKRGKSCC